MKVIINKEYNVKGGQEKVKIIAKINNDKFPLIGIITESDGNQYEEAYTEEGSFYSTGPSRLDLVDPDIIDWSSKVLVKSIFTDTVIRLVGIGEIPSRFAGVVVESGKDNYEIGNYAIDWSKNSFEFYKK